MRAAARIEVYGIGSSGPIAVDLAYRFLQLGLPAVALIDSHIQAVSAAMTGPQAAVITISHSGSTVETLLATRLAKEAGAQTIGITRFGKSPLQRYCDVVLHTVANETRYRPEAMSSRVAPVGNRRYARKLLRACRSGEVRRQSAAERPGHRREAILARRLDRDLIPAHDRLWLFASVSATTTVPVRCASFTRKASASDFRASSTVQAGPAVPVTMSRNDFELVAVCFAIALLKAIDEDRATKASRIGDERAAVKLFGEAIIPSDPKTSIRCSKPYTQRRDADNWHCGPLANSIVMAAVS